MGTWTLLLQNNIWLCSNVEKGQTSNPDINHDEELSSFAQCLTKPDKLKKKEKKKKRSKNSVFQDMDN